MGIGLSSNHYAINVQLYGIPIECNNDNKSKKLCIKRYLKSDISYGEHTISIHFNENSKKALICVIGSTNVFANLFEKGGTKDKGL